MALIDGDALIKQLRSRVRKLNQHIDSCVDVEQAEDQIPKMNAQIHAILDIIDLLKFPDRSLRPRKGKYIDETRDYTTGK